MFRIIKWGAPFGGGREGGGRGGSSLARSGNVLPPLPPTVGGRGDCCLQCYGSDKCSPLGGRRERAMRARGQIMCAYRRNRSPLRPFREHGARCLGSDKCSPLGGRRERAMRARGQIMCACRRNRSPLRPFREQGVFAAYTKAQKKR